VVIANTVVSIDQGNARIGAGNVPALKIFSRVQYQKQ